MMEEHHALKALLLQEDRLVSLPSPVAPWVQWSNELAREMYIKHALQWL